MPRPIVLFLICAGFAVFALSAMMTNLLQRQYPRNISDPEKGAALNINNGAGTVLRTSQRAAIITLIRNRELDDMIQTLEVFERRFNHRYGYPYIFLNDQPFSPEFRQKITETLRRVNSTATARFELVPVDHWGFPAWINRTMAAETRERMRNVIYGDSESYRFMCRYQSAFFQWHQTLDGLDYYWRLEPGTRLLCDVPYDPFELMEKRNLKYGFTISIGEFRETVPSLWNHTMEYVQNRRLNDPRYNPEFLRFFSSTGDNVRNNGKGTTEYNMCHFWSNFEIGSVQFMRSAEYTDYIKHLDFSGGFFYERWGDAPVHSLAAGLFLRKDQVHFFEDIGYYHAPLTHCPAEPIYKDRNCDCDKGKSMHLDKGWSCTLRWQAYEPEPWFK